jgi:hypothetical protein
LPKRARFELITNKLRACASIDDWKYCGALFVSDFVVTIAEFKMAAFLGTKETMQPRSAKQNQRGKRSRPKDGPEIEETATAAEQRSASTKTDIKHETASDTGNL